MTTLVLLLALGQPQPDHNSLKFERVEYVRQQRVLRGQYEAARRKERIARDWESGAAIARWYPGVANPYEVYYRAYYQEWYRRQLLYNYNHNYNYTSP